MDLDALQNVRVLLVDDDEDDYLITKKIFSRIAESPFQLEWVNDFDKAKSEIDKDAHDIYLIDYRLGEYTGLDILRYAVPEQRRQPFILLTGVGDSELEWRSLKMAASDYLVKGTFDAALLSRTLFYAIQRKYVERQRIDHLLELNRSKEEFISIASHQLRTPATGVKQYIGMVLEDFAGEVPPQQRELLEKAYQSNERQLRIVSDLLKVAQVDSGKMKLHTSRVEINELIEDVISEQHDSLSARQQAVIFHPLKQDQAIEIDADALRMVFENIIDNASKYSNAQTKITITIKNVHDEICISVKDTGVGIEESDTHRMFQKFSRINNPLSTRVGGTGLGLYWAKQIIDMHGGRIEYKANKPHGSIFLIFLPKRRGTKV